MPLRRDAAVGADDTAGVSLAPPGLGGRVPFTAVTAGTALAGGACCEAGAGMVAADAGIVAADVPPRSALVSPATCADTVQKIA
jgi:hypothetical protein